VALLASGALVSSAGLAGLAGPLSASASSHREAPAISGEPQYDTTDVYAFVSPDNAKTTTFIVNWHPFSEPAGGPNFYLFADDALYDINIDNDGDAVPDIIYRWRFRTSFRNGNTFLYNTGPVTSLNDPDLNIRQTYRLTRIDRDRGTSKVLLDWVPAAPSFVGDASMPNYAALRREAIRSYRSGAETGKAFAGQADDPFFLDLRVFDLLYGGDLSQVGDDTLAGFSVNSVALQVNSDSIRGKKDGIVGVWSTTTRRDARGKWRQVSRLGSPLVNEVVIPLKDKDRFNASKPRQDAQFAEYVLDPELPKLIEAVYGIPAPATPRNDLVQAFLTGVPGLNQPKKVKPAEMLRLNLDIPPTAKPKRLGVLEGDLAGFPNGRRLSDDVIDIALQVMEGELVGSPNDLGDAVNTNDKAFGSSFPYLALPTSGSAKSPHAGAGYTPLTGGNASGSGFAVPSGVLTSAALVGVGLLIAAAGAATLRRTRPALASS
jgi:hypothetical protein